MTNDEQGQVPADARCAFCGVKRRNCQAGGRYYNLCPFRPDGQAVHAWSVALDGSDPEPDEQVK